MSSFAVVPWVEGGGVQSWSEAMMTKDEWSDSAESPTVLAQFHHNPSGLTCWLVEAHLKPFASCGSIAARTKDLALKIKHFSLEFSYRFSDTYDEGGILDSVAARNPLRWSDWQPLAMLIADWYSYSEKKGRLHSSYPVNRIDVRVRMSASKTELPERTDLKKIESDEEFLGKVENLYQDLSKSAPAVSGEVSEPGGEGECSAPQTQIRLVVQQESREGSPGSSCDISTMANFLERVIDLAMEPGSIPNLENLTLKNLSRVKECWFVPTRGLPQLVDRFRKEWDPKLAAKESKKLFYLEKWAALPWVNLKVGAERTGGPSSSTSSGDVVVAAAWPWKEAMMANDGWGKKDGDLPSGIPSKQVHNLLPPLKSQFHSLHASIEIVEAPLQPAQEEWEKGIDCGVEDATIRAVQKEMEDLGLDLEFKYRFSDTWREGSKRDRIASHNPLRWSSWRPLSRRIKGWYSASKEKGPLSSQLEHQDVNRVHIKMRRGQSWWSTEFPFDQVVNAKDLLSRVHSQAPGLMGVVDHTPASEVSLPVRESGRTRLVIGIEESRGDGQFLEAGADRDTLFTSFLMGIIESVLNEAELCLEQVSDVNIRPCLLDQVQEVYWYVVPSAASGGAISSDLLTSLVNHLHGAWGSDHSSDFCSVQWPSPPAD